MTGSMKKFEFMRNSPTTTFLQATSTMAPTKIPGWLVYPVITFLAARLLLWRRRVKKLPPGPPKLPLFDNLFNMPAGLDWVRWAEMGKQYDSDIIQMGALGTSIVVLNTYEAARELLEQRSGIYSSRNVSTMTHDLTPIDVLFVLAPYGDAWRQGRRMFTKHFSAGNTVLSRPRDIFYVRRLLTQLLANPEDFNHHLSCLLSAISISMTYGVRPLAHNDPYALLSESAAETIVELVTKGPWMVDLVPVLRYLPTWFPGTNFLEVAAVCKQKMIKARDTLFDAGASAFVKQDHYPSFLSDALRELDGVSEAEAAEQKVVIKDVANMVYLAAFDTTLSAIRTWFLAMTCYPHVQAKLQDEIDQALQGRLPDHDDVEHLPYLTATLMEVLRWKPVLPPGVPHAAILDDVYNGYHIPKGSIVVANQWAMLQDPKEFPDPSEFRPERFLKDGQIDESVMDPANIAFGFGRRLCPGRHIALATLRLTMASVLLTFDIRKKLDANGEPIEPKQEYTFNLVQQPKPFPCVIKPRSKTAEDTITAWARLEGDNPP